MADFASESGHWYGADGSPQYTILGANGKERPTTLRDAKKLGLVPSVTTILRCASAPALEKWKRNQVLLAALTLPRLVEEGESAWLARVEQDWQDQSRKAAERGERIHGALEAWFRGDVAIAGPGSIYTKCCLGARDEIFARCGTQEWSPERSFAHAYGYGGKCDLHSSNWVIDYKTKEFGPENPPDVYDEHAAQLAAYRRGLGVDGARCAILFVSASEPGIVSFREIEELELERGLAMFDALLAYWCAKNRHWCQLKAAA